MRRPSRPRTPAVLAATVLTVGAVTAALALTGSGPWAAPLGGAPATAAGAASSHGQVTPGDALGDGAQNRALDSVAPSAVASSGRTASTSPTPRPSASALVSADPSPGPGLIAPLAQTPAPRVLPTKAPKASTAVPPRFPVPVTLGNATQVITVKAHGTYATVTGYQRVAGVWRAVLVTSAARVGSGGIVKGTSRHQGTGTTPTGTYTMTEAFGIHASPGTKMAYHRVTADDWWVEDNASAYYNTMRRASQGGFRTTLPSGSLNSSEHLINFTVSYQYAVVIDFNRPPNAVRYRGAGIFLHVNGSGSTAGCVSVPAATMVTVLRWLDPAQHPRIAIG